MGNIASLINARDEDVPLKIKHRAARADALTAQKKRLALHITLENDNKWQMLDAADYMADENESNNVFVEHREELCDNNCTWGSLCC